MLKSLPEKLNPIVKPLMESLKREENEELQVLFSIVSNYIVIIVSLPYAWIPTMTAALTRWHNT